LEITIVACLVLFPQVSAQSRKHEIDRLFRNCKTVGHRCQMTSDFGPGQKASVITKDAIFSRED
jgi:hypothetical protein